jgi:hypothetical protein
MSKTNATPCPPGNGRIPVIEWLEEVRGERILHMNRCVYNDPFMTLPCWGGGPRGGGGGGGGGGWGGWGGGGGGWRVQFLPVWNTANTEESCLYLNPSRALPL